MIITELESLDHTQYYKIGEAGISEICFDDTLTYYLIHQDPFYLRLHKRIIVVPAATFIAIYDDIED